MNHGRLVMGLALLCPLLPGLHAEDDASARAAAAAAAARQVLESTQSLVHLAPPVVEVAEPSGPPSTATYSFNSTDPGRLYLYESRQEASWTSADETLQFTTTLAWSFSLRCQQSSPDAVDLTVGIINVWASVSGPGSINTVGADPASTEVRRLDSAKPGDANDPLLGHLAALEGTQLVLHLDPKTGVVLGVDGGDSIAKRIARLNPDATDPGATSPMAAAASAMYSSDNLAHLWTGMFARPAAGALPLAAPLAGTLSRAWAGDRYTLSPGSGTRAVILGTSSASTPGELSEISGNGGNLLDHGWPDQAWGDLQATLTFAPLTQPVKQHLRLRWKLSHLEPSR